MNRRRSAPTTTAGRAGLVREALRQVVAMVLAAAAISLVGCTPSPTPRPTPTPPFATEAEAFRAAEQVFHEFVNAKNRMQNGDETVHPQKFLAGSALDSDIRSSRDAATKGTHIEGTTTVLSFVPKHFGAAARSVEALACMDIAQSRLMSSGGKDLTSPDRPPVVAVVIKAMPVRAEMRIFEISGGNAPC